jgi:hypothetical protein
MTRMDTNAGAAVRSGAHQSSKEDNNVSHGVSVTRTPSPEHSEPEAVLPAATSVTVVPTPNSTDNTRIAEPEAALLTATPAAPVTTAALVPLPNSTNNLTIGPKISELAGPLRAVMWSDSK